VTTTDLFALASSDWGVARFTTDSIALISLGILAGIPIILLKRKGQFKSLWAKGNVFSKY
tara:strand:- start:4 stop:183 length:180 start_codon:yes stop_codon:yes gene_type:complete